MPFYTYILKSKTSGKLYKGQTENLESRLAQHNAGKTKSTIFGIPWILVYYESFPNRKEALMREKYFKTAAGRRFINKLELDKELRVPRPND